MPKQVDAGEQRSEIRRAARRVFARRGVAGTGLAQVADAAGMGRSSLYHYYPDKASLLRDLLRELLDEEAELFVAAARGEGSPLERLERLASSLTDAFDAWARVGRMLVELRTRDARRFRPFFRRIRRALASLIAEGQRAGEIDGALDPALQSALLIGMIDGLLLQHLIEPGFIDRDALREALAGGVRRMLHP